MERMVIMIMMAVVTMIDDRNGKDQTSNRGPVE
jgi:hypothetical protein